MQAFRKLSIKRKQTLIILLTSGAALLLACAAFAMYEVAIFRKAMVRNLSTLAEIVGDSATAALEFNDVKVVDETLSALKAEPDIIGAVVYTKEGEVFAVYDRSHDNIHFAAPKVQKAGYEFNGRVLVIFQPIISKGEMIGTVYVESDLRALYSRLEQYVLIVLGVFFAATLVAFLISARLQRIISEPILQLVRVARQVAHEGNYSVRAAKESEDELGTLVDGFNAMLAQIQSRDGELQKANATLEHRVEERTGELANSLSLVNATLESTTDGILVINSEGNITNFNEQFIKQWGITTELAKAKDRERMIEFVTPALRNPEAFVAKIREMASRPDAESFDLLELKDGRVFERYSKPQRIGEKCVGRVWSIRDITQRRKAEETLRRTEELYRRAIAGADAVPYAYDYNSRAYVFMGEGIKSLIGYEASEMTHKVWSQIIQESVMGGETAGLDKAEAARRVKIGELRTWRCDMRVITRDGKTRWLSDASVQNLDESGKPIGSMGILQDITERKQAEITALAFSKLGERLSTAATPAQAARFISEIADELFGWDAFWLKLYMAETDTMQSMLSVDTINGKRVPQQSFEAETPTTRQRRVMEKGAELILRDAPAFSSDATPFGDTARPSASIMLSPIRYGTKVIGILSAQSYKLRAYSHRELMTLQAIADQCGGALERIRADEALRLLSSAMEQSADNIVISERDGVIKYANPAFLQLTGYGKEEVIGKTARMLKSGQHTDAFYQQLWRTILSGESFRAEFINRKKNGELYFEEKTITPVFDTAGAITHFVASGRDVTGRKQTEEELEQAHKQLLETSRRAGMAEVASNVLHNVGNVLNSVNVSAALLADRIRGSKISSLMKAMGLMRQHANDLALFLTEDPKGRQLPGFLFGVAEYLTEEQKGLLKELDLLAKNIEHIKDIVAMQQSYAKVSGVSETIAPAELIEDALRMNEAAFTRHQVQVTREYADVPSITVEKHKVLQILVNLMRNAKYALEESGKKEKPIRLRLERINGEAIRISVIDEGIGIPVENLTRIFNHGFTTRKQGHGFGLHSGALAAKELGGSLTVHSDGPGRGATFTLELPLQPGKTANA
jgi:PAS domain S-box-containing protein